MKWQVEGREAYAYTGGRAWEADRPAQLFIHGALHDHSVWTLFARHAAHHGWNALALDLPGHGRSAGPALASVEAGGAWLLALLAQAAPAGALLVGHSMGSLIALEAAAQDAARPPSERRVRGLMMVGTAFPMKVSAALLDTAAKQPERAIDMVNSMSIASLASKPSFPGPGMWLHGSNRALMQRVFAGPHAAGCEINLFHHDFACCDRYGRGLEAAAQVQVPSWVVAGERDIMTPPKAARALAQALKAREVTLPRAGHALMHEAPAAMQTVLQAAAASLQPLG